MLTLVGGGSRSGKSEYAESLIKNSATYIATGMGFDTEMKSRIKKHRDRRENSNVDWTTVECQYKIDENMSLEEYALFDSLGVFTSNVMYELTKDELTKETKGKTVEAVVSEIEKLVKIAKDFNSKLIIVTDETGLGVIPENKVARDYRDILGSVNQRVAKMADEVYFVAMGIGVKLK